MVRSGWQEERSWRRHESGGRRAHDGSSSRLTIAPNQSKRPGLVYLPYTPSGGTGFVPVPNGQFFTADKANMGYRGVCLPLQTST